MAVARRDCSEPFVGTFWPTLHEAKDFASGHVHLFKARIDEERWDDGAQHAYSWRHRKGTVVETYKGDWKAGERIEIRTSLDAPAPKDRDKGVGRFVLFSIDAHAAGEINVMVGEEWPNDPEIERAFACGSRRDE